MPERSNGLAWRASVPLAGHRGFESHPFRQSENAVAADSIVPELPLYLLSNLPGEKQFRRLPQKIVRLGVYKSRKPVTLSAPQLCKCTSNLFRQRKKLLAYVYIKVRSRSLFPIALL